MPATSGFVRIQDHFDELMEEEARRDQFVFVAGSDGEWSPDEQAEFSDRTRRVFALRRQVGRELEEGVTAVNLAKTALHAGAPTPWLGRKTAEAVADRLALMDTPANVIPIRRSTETRFG